MYFNVLNSINELVGEGGILRLPSYIFEVFVFDDERLRVLREAQKALIAGHRVLITGIAGTGKTALMAMILKNMFESGYGIGHILEDAMLIGREHEEKGVLIFYDDIVRMGKAAIRSLLKNNTKFLIATVRMEELKVLEAKLGCSVDKVFKVFKISPMSHDKLREILLRMAEKENIVVNTDAVDLVVSKAGSLPIYIWQLIRDLRVSCREVLDRDFAEKIPQGMLEYVDSILWKVLDEHKEKHEVLLTLRILADMPNYELHQDLLNTVFAVAKKRIYGGKVDIKSALLSDVFDHMTRYLFKTASYSFKLPHDSWADVLKGGSRGLISSDIARINSLFTYEARREILEEAAKICEEQVISKITDEQRKNGFYRQLRIAHLIMGKVKVNALDTIINVMLVPRDELARSLRKMASFSRIERDPALLSKFVIYSIIYNAKAEDKQYKFDELSSEFMKRTDLLGKLSRNVDRVVNKVSREDVHSIMYIYTISTANPEKSAYHLRKLIEYNGLSKVEELIGLMLLNMMPYNISDIVISAYWGDPRLARRIIEEREEFLYALSRMDAIGILQEVRDVLALEKSFGLEILNKCKDVLRRRIEKLDVPSRLEVVKRVADAPKQARKELIGVVRDYCIFSPEELATILKADVKEALESVSYTHLTLPTTERV